MLDPLFLCRLAACAYVTGLCWLQMIRILQMQPEPGDWRHYCAWLAAGAAPIFLLVVR